MAVSFGAGGRLEATGYRETKDRGGLCVSICTVIGSTISTVYSRIKVIRPMTNNTSWYRRADVNGTHSCYKQEGIQQQQQQKVARNLCTNLNTFTEWKANKIKCIFRFVG